MNLFRIYLLAGLLLSGFATEAALTVNVKEPKVTGSKVIVPIVIKNTFKASVESARAVLFLTDDSGKVVGQATHWIIGGTKSQPALAPDATITYSFVFTSNKPFTKTKLIVTRLVLENGKRADPVKDVDVLTK